MTHGTRDMRFQSRFPPEVFGEFIEGEAHGGVSFSVPVPLPWDLRNELREQRRSVLVWLVGERFSLELSDLDNLIAKWRSILASP